jgi:hypothetical protein
VKFLICRLRAKKTEAAAIFITVTANRYVDKFRNQLDECIQQYKVLFFCDVPIGLGECRC